MPADTSPNAPREKLTYLKLATHPAVTYVQPSSLIRVPWFHFDTLIWQIAGKEIADRDLYTQMIVQLINDLIKPGNNGRTTFTGEQTSPGMPRNGAGL